MAYRIHGREESERLQTFFTGGRIFNINAFEESSMVEQVRGWIAADWPGITYGGGIRAYMESVVRVIAHHPLDWSGVDDVQLLWDVIADGARGLIGRLYMFMVRMAKLADNLSYREIVFHGWTGAYMTDEALQLGPVGDIYYDEPVALWVAIGRVLVIDCGLGALMPLRQRTFGEYLHRYYSEGRGGAGPLVKYPNGAFTSYFRLRVMQEDLESRDVSRHSRPNVRVPSYFRVRGGSDGGRTHQDLNVCDDGLVHVEWDITMDQAMAGQGVYAKLCRAQEAAAIAFVQAMPRCGYAWCYLKCKTRVETVALTQTDGATGVVTQTDVRVADMAAETVLSVYAESGRGRRGWTPWLHQNGRHLMPTTRFDFQRIPAG